MFQGKPTYISRNNFGTVATTRSFATLYCLT